MRDSQEDLQPEHKLLLAAVSNKKPVTHTSLTSDNTHMLSLTSYFKNNAQFFSFTAYKERVKLIHRLLVEIRKSNDARYFSSS